MTNPIIAGVANGLRPDPRFTVTQWAETYRVLTSEASAEVGKYRVSRTPYLKEIMDVLSPTSPIEQVKVIKGTQLGLSTVGDNVALTYLDLYPCPVLYILPTEKLAKSTSKRRITPSILETPHLLNKVVDGKSKNDGGEVMTKTVPGGGLQFGWSQSTASFRSFSARVVLLDDVDGFGAFGEGDPLSLGKARADAMSNKKIYINSTPTIKGRSNIELEYEDSDQREYLMPCHYCKTPMIFCWDNMVYTLDDKGNVIPESVKQECPNCHNHIEEYLKTSMMREGEWVPNNPGHPYRGYKVPSFLSPLGWLSWAQITKEYLDAYKLMQNGDTRLMQVWKNTRCAETFAENLKGITINNATERVEAYGCEVPNDVLILTAGVDTQENRFELEVVGHCVGGETYSIDYKVIAGDPQLDSTKQLLDDYLIYKTFTRLDGQKMRIICTMIDTGGSRTKAMYEYCESRIANRIFGIKGSSSWNAPTVSKTIDQVSDEEFTLIMLNVNTLKDDLYARLKVKIHGNNYCHFPDKDVYNDTYFRMLTSEKKNEKGQYVKIRTRNEALDCRLYANAALEFLDIDLDSKFNPLLVVTNPAQPTNDIVENNEVIDYLDEF